MRTRYGSTLVFLTTMLVGGSVLLSTRLQEHELTSLSLLITRLSAGVVDVLGLAVTHDARTLFALDRPFALRVENDCNGAWAHLIFLAAVLAYPARWGEKALGVVLGQTALILLNVLRVVSLFLVGVYVPAVFRATHVYVWQFLIIGLALLLFFVWVDRCVRRPA